MAFRNLFHHFQEMKHYFIASALVFIFGFILGWQQPAALTQFLHNQIQGLQSMSNYVNGKENPQMWLFFVIFLNNAVKAILFVFLGLAFGVLPLSMLVINGMVLGYVLSAQNSESTIFLVLKGILPHGIIEIPAILIACAYGIKLGSLVVKAIINFLIPAVGKTARNELAQVLKITKPLIVFLAVSLLVAAIIESTVTFWLMGA
jgi:stage II sporulation protein M